MESMISVKEALKKAYLLIALPMLLLMCIVWTIAGIYISSLLGALPEWLIFILNIALGMLAGVFSAYLYWIFMINKWRVWAFKKVDNPYELKKKALLIGLMTETENWQGKYEYMSKPDKLKWEGIVRAIKEIEITKKRGVLNNPTPSIESINKKELIVENTILMIPILDIRFFLDKQEIGVLNADLWNSRVIGKLNGKEVRFIQKKRSNNKNIIDLNTNSTIGEIIYYSFSFKAKILLGNKEYLWRYDDWKGSTWSILENGNKILIYKPVKLRKSFLDFNTVKLGEKYIAKVTSFSDNEILLLSGFIACSNANKSNLLYFLFGRE